MPIEPTLAELLETAHRSFMLDVHVSMPAVVRKYTAGTQRGDFLPVVKGSVQDSDGNNVFEERPTIQNVPVRWERAGGYYDHKPLAAGDHGYLIFSEDSYAIWRTTGQVSEPGDLTRHSISYPFFLPGAWPDDDPLPDAPTGHAVSIVPAGGFLRVSKAGGVGAADFAALSAKVDANFQTLMTAFNSHAHPYLPGPGSATPTGPPASPLSAFPGTACTSLKSD
jgi:hypothetical protein